ncbi:MAG: amidohydrolase family protein [Calditrichaeota bacterium]|nr:MAG: amidohydrolase family protein [Calditrichota bacterium]
MIFTNVYAQKQIILKAARMLDIRTGKWQNHPTLLIKEDRIEAINPSSLPKDAKVVDLGNLSLLPGFIDLHTHLTYDIGPGWTMRPVKEGAADEALRGAYNARKTLMAGFTTVRNVGAGHFADVALMHAIDKGLAVGPHIFPAGHAIGITGGHCDITGFAPGILETGPEQGVADGPAAVLRAVRYQIKHGAKVIKICATAGVLSFESSVGAQQMSDEEMRTVVEEARRHGLRVAAHAHGTQGIIAAIKAGVTSIEHGSILNDEAIQLMKQKGTYLVPTSYLADVIRLDLLPPPVRKKAEYVLPIMRKSLRKAIQAGVKIAFGTDAGVYPHGDNAKEFAVYVKLGMSPLKAIQSATLVASECLGVDDRGALEPGKLADIIGVEGDPLKNIQILQDVKFVMKSGKVFKP